jgi:hypothetical protein
MNGFEFARCTTAGGLARVLVHAAPAQASVEIFDDDDRLVARAELDREGDYSPMTLLEIGGGGVKRSEVWPDESLYGVPVLLPGGEAGVLERWEHSPQRDWWRWSVEFTNSST